MLTAKDLKFLWMGIMLVLLISNADSFLRFDQQKSTYDAPWVYPANAL